MIQYDALIIGSGFSGLGTALALASKHYSVLILERESTPGGLLKDVCRGLGRLDPLLKLVRSNPGITLHTNAKIKSIGGFHPLFTVEWFHEGRIQTSEAGHIVFAMGLDLNFPVTLYPSGPQPGITLLPELEANICGNNWSAFSGKRILMVCGYNDPAPAYSMHLMLDRSLAMVAGGARVIVAAPNILFHSPATPQLYRKCREQGVLFIRSPQPPLITGAFPELQFEAVDPALAEQDRPALIHGHIDQVVYEPLYTPRQLKNIFWSPHHPYTGFDGYYQPDNPRFKPVRSERKGVFYVGAVTGFKSLADCREEVALAASEIMVQHPENPVYAEVDDSKCVVCLTCARICPHRAIYIDGSARVSQSACDGCGICVAECPAEAITLKRPGTEDLRDGFQPLPDHLPDWVVLYCCDGSTGPSWDSIRPNPLLEKYHLHVIRVPCSGRIAVSHLLEHLKMGAAGILVAACPVACCDHVHGNKLAVNRVRRVQNILETLNWDSGRVQIIHSAHGMEEKLIRQVDDFCKHLLPIRRSDSVISKQQTGGIVNDNRNTETTG